MRQKPWHFFAVFLQAMLCFPVWSQQPEGNYKEDLFWERSKLDNYIKALRPMLAEYGDESLKYIEKRVSFGVSDDPVPNAWVLQNLQKGQFTIFITPTYRLLITYLADADVISTEHPAFIECRQSYVDALFRTLADNRSRSANGKLPLRLPSPEVFLDVASPECKKFRSKFPIELKFRPARDYVVNTIIGLAYLHELGHVALGHSAVNLADIQYLPTDSQRLSEFLKLMVRSRSQENKADDWAIDRFVDLSNNPAEAMNNVLLTFYLAFGGFDCSFEGADSHPNGYQRFARQMSRMKARATVQGKFPKDVEISDLIDDAATIATDAKNKLNCP